MSFARAVGVRGLAGRAASCAGLRAAGRATPHRGLGCAGLLVGLRSPAAVRPARCFAAAAPSQDPPAAGGAAAAAAPAARAAAAGSARGGKGRRRVKAGAGEAASEGGAAGAGPGTVGGSGGVPEGGEGAAAADGVITARAADYAQWYLDVIAAGDLVDRSPVKGCMVMKARRGGGEELWRACLTLARTRAPWVAVRSRKARPCGARLCES